MSARFYDPLGEDASCIVNFKLLLKQIWDSVLDWNDPLSTSVALFMEKIISERIECCKTSSDQKVLYVTIGNNFIVTGFVMKAYAAVAYLQNN